VTVINEAPRGDTAQRRRRRISLGSPRWMETSASRRHPAFGLEPEPEASSRGQGIRSLGDPWAVVDPLMTHDRRPARDGAGGPRRRQAGRSAQPLPDAHDGPAHAEWPARV
jgi:hypothetical protein